MTVIKQHFKIEDLESVNRIVNIPIVHSGLNIAEHVYDRIKHANNMLSWTLDQAEDTIKAVAQNPAMGLLESPLHTIDRVICKSLDVVESKIPSINLPPKMIYSNTKDYLSDVSTKIVKPVLKRADSVKQISNTVLTNKYTEYAADKLDDALNVADAYIDKYFPDQEERTENQESETSKDSGEKKAIHTMKHADRVSRKLQRRLTRRTLEHAKIIKEQGTEAIHVLLYVAELVATDPQLAYQKGKELWAELSKDEPENQARPKNVEELFVLVVRESARRLVHLINYSSIEISKLPKLMIRTVRQTSALISEEKAIIAKNLHLDEVEKFIHDAMHFVLQEMKSFTSQVLEQARNSETDHSVKSAVVLTVPKIELSSKAATNKVNSNENQQKHRDHVDHHTHHSHHRSQHGHHNHRDQHIHKRNGPQSAPAHTNGASETH